MDFSILAGSLIAFLSPYALKILDKSIDTLTTKYVEEGFEERRAVWDKVKGIFDYDEPVLLGLFNDAENNLEKKGELKGELKGRLQSNPETARELEEMLEKISSLLPPTTSVQIKSGDNSRISSVIVEGNVGGDSFAGDKNIGDVYNIKK